MMDCIGGGTYVISVCLKVFFFIFLIMNKIISLEKNTQKIQIQIKLQVTEC